MAENRRYYWLKLKEDFFTDKRIKRLRRISGGDTYTIIYLKLLLLSLKDGGKLYYDGVETDFIKELALTIDEKEDDVMVTVNYLMAQNLIEVIAENDEYFLTEMPNLIGSETASTRRSRKSRAYKENQKALQCNTNATPCNTLEQNGSVEKEIEKEIEIDKEKDINTLCPEVETSEQKVFISLPLVTGSGSFDVTFDYLNSLRQLYPAIDVEQEFRKMCGWLDSNPRNRKTARGIKRFITGWLSRAQDKAPAYRPHPGGNRNIGTEQYMESTAGWND